MCNFSCWESGKAGDRHEDFVVRKLKEIVVIVVSSY